MSNLCANIYMYVINNTFCHTLSDTYTFLYNYLGLNTFTSIIVTIFNYTLHPRSIRMLICYSVSVVIHNLMKTYNVNNEKNSRRLIHVRFTQIH